MEVIDSLRGIFEQMPDGMSPYVNKVFKSLDKQEKKFMDSSLTPSGKILDELKNNKTWEELNLELFNNHSKVLRDKNLDLGYLNEEAKNSLDKFKELEEIDEIRFDEYLDKFIKDI